MRWDKRGERCTWSMGSSTVVFSSSATSSAPRTSSLILFSEALNTLCSSNIITQYHKRDCNRLINKKSYIWFSKYILFNCSAFTCCGFRWGSLCVWVSANSDRSGVENRVLLSFSSPSSPLNQLRGTLSLHLISCGLHTPAFPLKADTIYTRYVQYSGLTIWSLFGFGWTMTLYFKAPIKKCGF